VQKQLSETTPDSSTNEYQLPLSSQSSDLGKKSSTISTEPGIEYENESPFIFQIIPNQILVPECWIATRRFIFTYSSSRARLKNANIVSKLAIWKINALIFILVSIVESTIIFQTDVPNTRNYKSKEPLWVDDFLAMVINSQEDISVIP
jgi:hypothetical protein